MKATVKIMEVNYKTLRQVGDDVYKRVYEKAMLPVSDKRMTTANILRNLPEGAEIVETEMHTVNIEIPDSYVDTALKEIES